MLRKRRLKG